MPTESVGWKPFTKCPRKVLHLLGVARAWCYHDDNDDDGGDDDDRNAYVGFGGM